jgi:hypothetical protein
VTRAGWCGDKAVDISATGTVVIVDQRDECKKDPVQNHLLPSAIQPVRVVVQSVNTGVAFPRSLDKPETRFSIPIKQIGHSFTFHFYYSASDAMKYHSKEYDVLFPPKESLARLPSPQGGGELNIDLVCLSRVPKSANSNAMLLGDNLDSGLTDETGWSARFVSLSSWISPFREFTLFDPLADLADFADGDSNDAAHVVTGRILTNAKAESTAPPARGSQGVAGLRITVTGGRNDSDVTEYINQGLSDDNGNYKVELKEGKLPMIFT